MWRLARLTVPFLPLMAAGCELAEVTIVDFEDVVIAEAFVTVGEDALESSATAFIHGAVPGSGPSSQTFDDAVVFITDGDGAAARLSLSPIEQCAALLAADATGSCFSAGSSLAGTYTAGERLALDVSLADGRTLTGATTVPGAFSLDGVPRSCRLTPDRRLPLLWTRSDSAWAYISEASIRGLRGPLADEGIQAPDTVELIGLSISASDTTVSFPDQFGVFDRFDLDRDLAVRLQDGLPEGASAEVAIGAVDRNHANWIRGGSFNPSGAVRIPSVIGDGSGVFGSAVVRRFTVVSSGDTAAGPLCGAP